MKTRHLRHTNTVNENFLHRNNVEIKKLFFDVNIVDHVRLTLICSAFNWLDTIDEC